MVYPAPGIYAGCLTQGRAAGCLTQGRAPHTVGPAPVSHTRHICRVQDIKIASKLPPIIKNRFLSSRPTEVDEVSSFIKSVVTDDINKSLISSFSRAEIECALNQMAPLKAPSPDGLNHTFISLIPKVKNPEYITEFRPIALCNILYKLISKVLANKPKKVLPHIISNSQSAFQSNKVISNNILVAFETLHHMKRKKGGKVGHLALKLDISKAYDRLEWVFLKKVMERMGFHSRWIGWIMECIQLVTYSVLVNGEPSETIIPTRGIRQGDPLSPYLFLLCSECLNGLIEQAVAAKSLEGFSLCKYGPKISHLLFADDSFLFCRARVEDVSTILEILGKYKEASGQKLNSEKTTIFFGGDVTDLARLQGQSLLGVPEIREYEKYLGLSVVVGRHKKTSFNYIKDRVWGKLQGWKEKLISQARKEVLLKAVVQAISTFAMSCFRLPVWRLVHEEHSLFYKVFKAKYFPHGSIFEAKVSFGSFAWQSILKSRHLIEMGARWRVGDGQHVRIFTDKWLLNGEGVLSSSSGELHPEATVSKLINRTSGWWNVQLIDRCFHPPDAARIKALPLCSFSQSDVVIWSLEKSGKYSVKSGFCLLCESWDSVENLPQASTDDRVFWKKLWRIQELVNLVFTRFEQVPLFATIAWSVWFHRNKIRLGEIARSLGQIVGYAQDYLHDFKSLKRCTPTINFDEAMYSESEDAGVGVVVRNSFGEVKAALAKKIRKPPSVDVLELLAARRAALFSEELGLDRVNFEGDLEQVMKALQWGGWDFAPSGHLIRDILCIVNSFVSTSFSHVCRQGNTVAHALA
ncbi:uncharacterized protein LOC142634749 [Castanea sativa]|uniref:uncharacterized protein LOC142634749 n=1 Tax=Castanea sativa TaxID=21020 RepID=UPI003F6522B7